jgi:hypothetical protein
MNGLGLDDRELEGDLRYENGATSPWFHNSGCHHARRHAFCLRTSLYVPPVGAVLLVLAGSRPGAWFATMAAGFAQQVLLKAKATS